MQLRLAHLSCVMLGAMQVAATRPRKVARNGETFQKNQMEAKFSESPKSETDRACVSWQVTLKAYFLNPVQTLLTMQHDKHYGFFPEKGGRTWVKPWILPKRLLVQEGVDVYKPWTAHLSKMRFVDSLLNLNETQKADILDNTNFFGPSRAEQKQNWEMALEMLHSKVAHGLWWEIPDEIKNSEQRTSPNIIKQHNTEIKGQPWIWFGSDVHLEGAGFFFLNTRIKNGLDANSKLRGPCANVTVSGTSETVELSSIYGLSFGLSIRVLTLEIRGEFEAAAEDDELAKQRIAVEARTQEFIRDKFKTHMQGPPTYFREKSKEHLEYEYAMDMTFEFNDG